MPFKDPQKQRQYFRDYDAKRAAARKAAHKANPEKRLAEWRRYDAKRGPRTEYNKRRYEANAEKFRAFYRARYAANPQAAMQKHNEWYVKNKQRMRDYNRRRDGLPEPRWPMHEQCECCGTTSPDKLRSFNLDHCHETGQFRGWLCGSCNRGIGLLSDNLEGVMRAVRYLKRAEIL